MGTLSDRMRHLVVVRFYGEHMPEGVRLLFRPDRAFQAALIYEHWRFLQGFPRWVGAIMAGTDKLDVIEYEVENLYGELVHDPGVRQSHYRTVLQAGVEAGLTEEEILSGPTGEKMERAIRDWFSIARERPWIESLAAVHGTEMLADQRLKEVPGYRPPHQMGDEEFLQGSGYTSAGRSFLSTTRADTAHAGRAAALVEKYATDDGVREAVFRTFSRSMDNMGLYFEAVVDRRREFRERFHDAP